MGIFSKITQKVTPDHTTASAQNQSAMAKMALDLIDDGILILDEMNKILFINPAALTMLGCSDANEALGSDYLSFVRLENGEGMEIPDDQNPLAQAIVKNETFSSRSYVLTTLQGKKTPVAITLTFSGHTEKIIALRDITNELKEEGEQTEFISTASHEMRTPVASIEGYLGLALNPATATIDGRARQYLGKAHEASQHLGRLFRDLLDVTKLDDKRMKVHLVPTEMITAVKSIADAHTGSIAQKKLKYSFGTQDEIGDSRITMDQLIYSMVDVDFLREILDNLIENAVKYTPEGGAVWVNVRGDGDKALINVTDTGMGIAPDDLSHIFQKFYRVDNSQTRTIGGTGLGLYIVKQRVEAMGGRVWAESAFGEGTTFYVSLPRISAQEYERQKQVIANMNAMQQPSGTNEQNSALGQVAMIANAASAVSVPAVDPSAAPAPTEVATVGAMPVEAPAATTPVPTGAMPTGGATSGSPNAAADMSPERLEAMKAAFAKSVSVTPQVAPQQPATQQPAAQPAAPQAVPQQPAAQQPAAQPAAAASVNPSQNGAFQNA